VEMEARILYREEIKKKNKTGKVVTLLFKRLNNERYGSAQFWAAFIEKKEIKKLMNYT